MTQNDTVSNPDSTQSAKPAYVCPRLTIVGYAHDVILGIAGGGDDFFGYSRSKFEIVADGDQATEV